MSLPRRIFAIVFGLAFACGPAPPATVASGPSAAASSTGSAPSASGGRLPPEQVRKVIRANFPRFRRCYEQGLLRNAGLEGIVGVKFVIAEDGHVEGAFHSDGTLADPQVIDCVVDVYKTLVFPAPEGGKVAVHFPIDFRNNEPDGPQYPGLNGQPPPDCRSPQVMASAVAERSAHFKDCAIVAYQKGDRLGGYTVVDFTIEPSGTVSNATASHSTQTVPEAAQCIVAAFWSLQFPACGNVPVVVRYPITLNPHDDCTTWKCVEIGK